jgi:hypothetical protein
VIELEDRYNSHIRHDFILALDQYNQIGENKMPRVDNSDPVVISFFNLEFDKNDPGATEPVDLCVDCVVVYEAFGVHADVEHPPYENDEGFYHCLECGDNLYERDN